MPDHLIICKLVAENQIPTRIIIHNHVQRILRGWRSGILLLLEHQRAIVRLTAIVVDVAGVVIVAATALRWLLRGVG